jgi:hypothetical protein
VWKAVSVQERKSTAVSALLKVFVKKSDWIAEKERGT